MRHPLFFALASLALLACGTNEKRPELDAGADVEDSGARVCEEPSGSLDQSPAVFVSGGPIAPAGWQSGDPCAADVMCPTGASVGAPILEVNGRSDIAGSELCPGDDVRVLIPIVSDACSLSCQPYTTRWQSPLDGDEAQAIVPALRCESDADAYVDISTTLTEAGVYRFSAAIAPDCPTRIDASFEIALGAPR